MTYQIQAAISTRSIDSYQIELCNSFILDTRADSYVCNNREKFLIYTVT